VALAPIFHRLCFFVARVLGISGHSPLNWGGRYISVLSWNLFGLEELCRYIVERSSSRELARTATGPASLVAAAIAAPIFTAAAALIRSPRLRAAGVVIAILLGIGTLVWIPNPWENM
jgi:hypothetical protein